MIFHFIHLNKIVLCFLCFRSNTEKVDDSKDEKLISASEYNPEKNYYHPIKSACWRQGERLVDVVSIKGKNTE